MSKIMISQWWDFVSKCSRGSADPPWRAHRRRADKKPGSRSPTRPLRRTWVELPLSWVDEGIGLDGGHRGDRDRTRRSRSRSRRRSTKATKGYHENVEMLGWRRLNVEVNLLLEGNTEEQGRCGHPQGLPRPLLLMFESSLWMSLEEMELDKGKGNKLNEVPNWMWYTYVYLVNIGKP